jgi:protein-S-isoprenylcysteine O-methyltransferase Ste14
MTLNQRLMRLGSILFRFRSYVWFLLLPLMLAECEFWYARGTHRADRFFEVGCLLLALAGELVRMMTIGFIARGTSGRNTTEQKAEVLNTTGAYSVVRNPLYLGNYLVLMGITVLFQDWELVVINSLAFIAIYVPIIMTEEQFLLSKFGQEYQEYTSRVPCLLPKPWKYVGPRLDWSWRMVLRREHDTVLGIVLLCLGITCFRDYVISGAVQLDAARVSLLAGSVAVWMVVKCAKKFTRLLVVPVPSPV